MAFLRSLFEKPSLHLAFVLTHDAPLPTADALAAAWTAFDTGGLPLDAQLERDVLAVSVGGHSAFISQMPAPVPRAEVEAAAALSLSRFDDDAGGLDHTAHFILAVTPARGTRPVEQLDTLVVLAAALSSATQAVGVYLGGTGVAHPAGFLTQALDAGPPYVPLWCGLSLTRAGDTSSALTRGLRHAGLREVEVLGSARDAERLTRYAVNFASYVAGRGKDLPHGDTIGMSETERLHVKHVPSPVDPSTKVCRIEL